MQCAVGKDRVGTEGLTEEQNTVGESKKVKDEMFTWDSSGCMGKESVSIMYYQKTHIDREEYHRSSCNHEHISLL